MASQILDRFGQPVTDPEGLPRTHHRDVPITSSWTMDDVGVVRTTLRLLEVGEVVRFDRVAQLCDAFDGDDRIAALLETRLEALASLPLQVPANGKTALARTIAEQIGQDWPRWFPDAELKKLHGWGLKLGFAIGELAWDRSASEWTPRLKAWDLRNAEWRWSTRSFWVNTVDGPVEVTPGDGHWILYAPHGVERAWMKGLVRSLARLFLMRQLTYRDWVRWCEVHGLPIRVGTIPSGADKPTKNSFISDLLNIGGEATLVAEKDAQGFGYDLKLVEAASQSWQGFQQLIAQVEENLAVRMLGQNLTTSMKSGGSYAAANVHDRIRLERLEGDAKSLGTCLGEQCVRPWVTFNFNRSDLTPNAGWLTNTNANVDPTSALAGPQVTALADVVGRVAREELPRESGVRIIEACFPLTLEQAEAVMGEVGRGFKAKPAPAPPVAAPGPAPSDPKDDEPVDPKEQNAA